MKSKKSAVKEYDVCVVRRREEAMTIRVRATDCTNAVLNARKVADHAPENEWEILEDDIDFTTVDEVVD